VKSLKPATRVWGVETEGADAMSKALAAGRPVQLEAITSIARTLGAPMVSERTLMLAQTLLESVTVVPDSEAMSAVRLLLERAKVLTEPAASCTWAAAERLREHFSHSAHLSPTSKVVLVLCGGNIALDDLCRYQA
jgi:threonine dehydratase